MMKAGVDWGGMYSLRVPRQIQLRLFLWKMERIP